MNVSSASSNYYGHEDVIIYCLSTLTNITIQIIVQKTAGATYSSAYNSFFSGAMIQNYVDTGTQIIYTWTIVSGQTITCGVGSYQVSAQFNLLGTQQTMSADTYVVTATTSGGVTSTRSGHF